MRNRQHALTRWAALTALLFSAVLQALSQERRLTLQEAVQLAQRENHILKAAAFGVAADQQKKRAAKSQYFPFITNETNVLHISDLQRIEVPASAFGPGIPAGNMFLTQGTETLETSGSTIAQPITQLIKIHAANGVAAAEVRHSQAVLKKAENDIVYRVHELYYRVLTSQLQLEAAKLQITAGTSGMQEAAEQVKNGSTLDVALIESKASLLDAKQVFLTTEMRIADLTVELNDLLGLPIDTKLVLDPDVSVSFDLPSREESLKAAEAENPEIKEAIATLNKARAAEAAAKAEYIPDITAFARHSYQNGLPFFDRNFGTVGMRMTYEVFDAGKRQALIRERQNEVAAATESLRQARDEVEVRISMIYNRLEVARAMVEVKQQYLSARQESARLAEQQFQQGVMLVSQRDASQAQVISARAGLLDANLAFQLARDDLNRVLGGTTP